MSTYVHTYILHLSRSLSLSLSCSLCLSLSLSCWTYQIVTPLHLTLKYLYVYTRNADNRGDLQTNTYIFVWQTSNAIITTRVYEKSTENGEFRGKKIQGLTHFMVIVVTIIRQILVSCKCIKFWSQNVKDWYRNSRTIWFWQSYIYIKFWSRIYVSNFGHKMLNIYTGTHELYLYRNSRTAQNVKHLYRNSRTVWFSLS